MRPLFHVSGACASAFALGFIGGYPVGAKTAISLYENGMCTKTEAERLLAFCNNSGPAFILGVVGAGVFASSRVGVLLYLAHAAASICIGILFRFYKAGPTARREERQPRPQFHAQRFTTAFTGSIKNSFLSTLNICAFVVFFTVVIQLLIRSGFLPGLAQVLGTVLAPFGLTPEWAQRLLTGALEISSGVWTLSGDGTLSGKLILAAFMLGWAGISVHCQVLSFIGGSGLSVGTYLVGKLLHGGLSALFIAVLVRLFPLEAPVSDYLADQVAGIAGMDFHRTLVISLVCAGCSSSFSSLWRPPQREKAWQEASERVIMRRYERGRELHAVSEEYRARCTYCQRGTPLDEEKILCTKQGVVAPGGSCRSFKYDPLKRVPPPPVAPTSAS